MLTHSEENYLKAVFFLSREGKEKVSLTSLAASLGNNPASVIDMLKKLRDKKFVKYDKKNGAKLSDKGLEIALQIIRRHRLWEMFLQQKLNYSWDEVHEIAEQLEHVQFIDLADRLDKLLDYPKYDPHGEAIPKSDGLMPLLSATTLSEVDLDKNCKIVAVKDTSKAFLQYLQKLNIGIGTQVKILERIPFDDSLIILVSNSKQTTVTKKFADNLLVDKI